MLYNILILLCSVSILFISGNSLVHNSIKLATLLKLAPVIIGSTIVAFGTSVPELVVTIDALYTDHPDIVLGNIIGSNIVNLILVLPLAALIYPILVDRRIVAREGSIMLATCLLLWYFAFDKNISQLEGAILLLCFIGFVVMGFVVSDKPEQEQLTQQAIDQFKPEQKPDNLYLILLKIVGAVGIMVIGAHFFVASSVRIGSDLGLSEVTIGLTIVAVGSAMPEIIITAISAFKRHSDVAIGNILGSNIFNILGVGGLAFLLKPVSVDTHFLRWDFGALVVASLLILSTSIIFKKINRISASLFLAIYIGYTYSLFTV